MSLSLINNIQMFMTDSEYDRAKGKSIHATLPKGHKVCVFHAADIQRIIKKQFGISYHVRSVRRLLKRLGYSYVSSRPEHPKGDPDKRETFKKKSVIRSGNSVLIILE